ncbi:MAG: glycoside hydrolase family 25 protein [Saprospiraceae bacterium]|nr:glycoside hydrolase family 25 protein [Saprospiraceae bacterium]MDW8484227.1 GH25 family lysozyme [Saprospiraceae bacterium]
MRLFALVALLLCPIRGKHDVGVLDVPSALLLGIDISHHQRRIDWQRLVENSELHFVFVKATEGGDFVDTLFAENWAILRQMGIRRGAYHYFRPNRDGVLQAQHFLKATHFEPGDLAPVLDLETTDGLHPDIVRREALEWLDYVERTLHIRPIVYTNLNFYERHLAGYFEDYPLWIARYAEGLPQLRTHRWHFWQFTEKGRLPGIPRPVDLNVFRGTPSMLERLCWYPKGEKPSLASLKAP